MCSDAISYHSLRTSFTFLLFLFFISHLSNQNFFKQLIMYINFGTINNTINFVMQMALGSLVNGPYALITTAVAADLGNKVTNSQALATVTAIIDGTGSIGAALGPLIAGFVADYSWNDVFYMVLIADVIAMLLLYRIVIAEVKRLRRRFSTLNH